MRTALLQMTNFNLFKRFLATLGVVLTFLSCSSDDDKSENFTSEIEYYVQIQSETNTVLEIDYIDSKGDVVTVSGNHSSIKLMDGVHEWSKTIKYNSPFEAKVTVRMRNTSNVRIPYLIAIFKGDDIMALSNGGNEPASSIEDFATYEDPK